VIASARPAFALRFSDHIDQPGGDILAEACRLGLEGIVSKQKALPYVSGRGEHWVKSKCMLRQEFVVVGFLPASTRKDAVGSLVLGYYEKGRLMHAGRAGTGYSMAEAASLHQLLAPLQAPKPKFGNTVPRLAARDVVWVRPQMVAEIEYRGRTSDGLLRQAAYAGLREDKPAAEVGLEPDMAFIPQHEAPRACALHPRRQAFPSPTRTACCGPMPASPSRSLAISTPASRTGFFRMWDRGS
jgi:bifunctional non-homologous end joining protein LigD